ncbi:MAG: hypothetical protein H6735_23245 [Alphaproteobacteria bacterium]|nr:hypothetical protein [Alphaproteobacteria bacterium]
MTTGWLWWMACGVAVPDIPDELVPPALGYGVLREGGRTWTLPARCSDTYASLTTPDDAVDVTVSTQAGDGEVFQLGGDDAAALALVERRGELVFATAGIVRVGEGAWGSMRLAGLGMEVPGEGEPVDLVVDCPERRTKVFLATDGREVAKDVIPPICDVLADGRARLVWEGEAGGRLERLTVVLPALEERSWAVEEAAVEMTTGVDGVLLRWRGTGGTVVAERDEMGGWMVRVAQGILTPDGGGAALALRANTACLPPIDGAGGGEVR